MKRLQIITGATPGLLHSAEQLTIALAGDVECDTLALSAANRWGRWPRLKRRFDPLTRPADRPPLAFIESLYGNWMATSRANVWLPHLEWVDERSAGLVTACTQVWCMTRQSERIIRERGGNALHIGFSSRDRHQPGVEKRFDRFLHVAGRSLLKGTAAVVRAWCEHPHWPELTVVARPSAFAPVAADNIRYVTDFVSEDSLTNLMNSCGVHLCTSEAEGFGHYIVEGMSTAAVVITTDAAPMNEHLSPGEGLLVAPAAESVLSWGIRSTVTTQAVANTVEHLLDMRVDERTAMGQRARSRYLAERSRFHHRVRAAAASL